MVLYAAMLSACVAYAVLARPRYPWLTHRRVLTRLLVTQGGTLSILLIEAAMAVALSARRAQEGGAWPNNMNVLDIAGGRYRLDLIEWQLMSSPPALVGAVAALWVAVTMCLRQGVLERLRLDQLDSVKLQNALILAIAGVLPLGGQMVALLQLAHAAVTAGWRGFQTDTRFVSSCMALVAWLRQEAPRSVGELAQLIVAGRGEGPVELVGARMAAPGGGELAYASPAVVDGTAAVVLRITGGGAGQPSAVGAAADREEFLCGVDRAFDKVLVARAVLHALVLALAVGLCSVLYWLTVRLFWPMVDAFLAVQRASKVVRGDDMPHDFREGVAHLLEDWAHTTAGPPVASGRKWKLKRQLKASASIEESVSGSRHRRSGILSGSISDFSTHGNVLRDGATLRGPPLAHKHASLLESTAGRRSLREGSGPRSNDSWGLLDQPGADGGRPRRPRSPSVRLGTAAAGALPDRSGPAEPGAAEGPRAPPGQGSPGEAADDARQDRRRENRVAQATRLKFNPGLLNHAGTWGWSVLRSQDGDILQAASYAFFKLRVPEELCTRRTFVDFALAALERHPALPYHSAMRAIACLHAAYTLVAQFPQLSLPSPTDRLVLLVSALCANLASTGRSDDDLVREGHEYAVTYHFNMPQANAAVAKLTAASLEPGRGIFAALSHVSQRAVMQKVSMCVVAAAPESLVSLRRELLVQRSITLVGGAAGTERERDSAGMPPDLTLRVVCALSQLFHGWADADDFRGWEGRANLQATLRGAPGAARPARAEFWSGHAVPLLEVLAEVLPTTRGLLEGTLRNLAAEGPPALESSPGPGTTGSAGPVATQERKLPPVGSDGTPLPSRLSADGAAAPAAPAPMDRANSAGKTSGKWPPTLVSVAAAPTRAPPAPGPRQGTPPRGARPGGPARGGAAPPVRTPTPPREGHSRLSAIVLPRADSDVVPARRVFAGERVSSRGSANGETSDDQKRLPISQPLIAAAYTSSEGELRGDFRRIVVAPDPYAGNLTPSFLPRAGAVAPPGPPERGSDTVPLSRPPAVDPGEDHPPRP